MSRDWLDSLAELLGYSNSSDYEPEGILEPEKERLKRELHRGDRRSREMIVRELYQSRDWVIKKSTTIYRKRQ